MYSFFLSYNIVKSQLCNGWTQNLSKNASEFLYYMISREVLYCFWTNFEFTKISGEVVWVQKLKYNLKNFGSRVSVQGVVSLGGHLANIMPGVWFLWRKKLWLFFFQKENGNTFTFLIILIVKKLQKEQNGTNQLLWPPICRNKRAITLKWINSYKTNFNTMYFKTMSFDPLFDR